jgi:hypothetical protein
MIELTPEQRQALEQQNGEPVRVVDPATHDVYVLVRAEVYERLAGVKKPPAPAAPPCQPLRQRVRDLPLPPEVAAEAARYGKQIGCWWAKDFRQLEEQMKVQHYYGGKWIAFLETDEGPVVVAVADDLNDPSFDQQLSFLTAEERRSAILDSPSRLFDTESEILTPFPDES